MSRMALTTRGRRSKRLWLDQSSSRFGKVVAVAEAQFSVGKEAGVGAQADWDIDAADDEGEIGVIGREVEVVDTRDLLIALRGVSVWSLGAGFCGHWRRCLRKEPAYPETWRRFGARAAQ